MKRSLLVTVVAVAASVAPARAGEYPDLGGRWLGRIVCTQELGGRTSRLVQESTLSIHQEPGFPDLEVRVDHVDYVGFIVDATDLRRTGVGALVARGSNDDPFGHAGVIQLDWRLPRRAESVSGRIRGRGMHYSGGGFPINECRGTWKRVERALAADSAP